MLYISGCLPLNVHGDLVGPGDIQKQTAQVLANVKAIADAGGSEVKKIIKTIVSIPGNLANLVNLFTRFLQVFLKNVDDFPAMNAAYEKFFGDHKPARSTVEVARIPRDVLLEIEAIALYVAGSSYYASGLGAYSR